MITFSRTIRIAWKIMIYPLGIEAHILMSVRFIWWGTIYAGLEIVGRVSNPGSRDPGQFKMKFKSRELKKSPELPGFSIFNINFGKYDFLL